MVQQVLNTLMWNDSQSSPDFKRSEDRDLIPSDELVIVRSLGACPKSDVIKSCDRDRWLGSDDVNRLGRPCWRAKAGFFSLWLMTGDQFIIDRQ